MGLEDEISFFWGPRSIFRGVSESLLLVIQVPCIQAILLGRIPVTAEFPMSLGCILGERWQDLVCQVSISTDPGKLKPHQLCPVNGRIGRIVEPKLRSGW